MLSLEFVLMVIVLSGLCCVLLLDYTSTKRRISHKCEISKTVVEFLKYSVVCLSTMVWSVTVAF